MTPKETHELPNHQSENKGAMQDLEKRSYSHPCGEPDHLDRHELQGADYQMEDSSSKSGLQRIAELEQAIEKTQERIAELHREFRNPKTALALPFDKLENDDGTTES